MKAFSILGFLTFNVIAYDSVYISFYANPDCTGNRGGGVLTDIVFWFNI